MLSLGLPEGPSGGHNCTNNSCTKLPIHSYRAAMTLLIFSGWTTNLVRNERLLTDVPKWQIVRWQLTPHVPAARWWIYALGAMENTIISCSTIYCMMACIKKSHAQCQAFQEAEDEDQEAEQNEEAEGEAADEAPWLCALDAMLIPSAQNDSTRATRAGSLHLCFPCLPK